MHAARKGTNASGMRRYNERLILSAIRRSNGASKAELARASGLSPQAVVRIVDQLEADAFLVPVGKRTGGMGQPATIYRINGSRGYTVGVEVGRSRLTLALLDFDGERKADRRIAVAFPSIDSVLDEVDRFTQHHLADLAIAADDAMLGVGIAMPWFLGEWREETGISEDQASEWRDPEVEARLRAGIRWPVFFENDGNAATLAQALCGSATDLQNFLYVNIGPFIGGGLVLGGRIVQGRHGNAGALASMPIAADGGTDYLIHHASLYTLQDDPGSRAEWTRRCAEALSFAIIGANSLLDLEAVVIDGALPPDLLAALVTQIEDHLQRNVPPDFFRPEIRAGEFGERAAAIGAGLLPLHASFSPDLASLFKPAADSTN